MVLDRDAYFSEPRYKRGQVCKALGITKDTLRHYESCGIIAPKANESNGYKYYSIADLEILNVILFLRAIEVSIQDIPRFIQCKDIDSYEGLLSEQIDKVTLKVKYWTYVESLLRYFHKTLEDYKKEPNKVTLVEDIRFKFHKGKFDHKEGKLEKMAASKGYGIAVYHISKLKIVDRDWVLSNREDASNVIVGHLYSEEETEDVSVCTLSKALMMTTLEPLEKLPEMIQEVWKAYKEVYEFEDKVYFVEHSFLNVFNQGELLRNIYLPIVKAKTV